LTRVIRQPGDWILIGTVTSLWVAGLNISNNATGGAIYGNSGLKNAVNDGKVNQSVSVTFGVDGVGLLISIQESEPNGGQRTHLLL